MKTKRFAMVAIGIALALTISAQTHRDAVVNNLRGHVRSVTVTQQGQSATVYYDQMGNVQDNTVSNKQYNAQGFLISCNLSQEGMSGSAIYEYNSNGLLKSFRVTFPDGQMITEHTYNAEGFPIHSIVTMSSGGMSQSMEMTATYSLKDGHGNWLKRTLSANGYSVEETRTIVYW